MEHSSQFSSKIGFIAAAAGSAVGLGNIWKFPYEVGMHGGASFLLVYFVCILLLAYPLMVTELAFGRVMQKDAYHTFKDTPGKKWDGLGIVIILEIVLILTIYMTISSWTLGYLLSMISGTLLQVSDTAHFFTNYTQSAHWNLAYAFVSVLLPVLIVQKDINQGIEKWSKILMPAFLFMLIGLMLYAWTLDNAWEGIYFYLVPDFSAITIEVVYSALAHSFFSLSVGVGVMIIYGGYMDKKENILQSATLITISDTAVAFCVGLFLFPFIFSQHIAPTQGATLAFVSLPLVFQSLGPLVGTVVGATFFLLLAFSALTSAISLFEVVTAYIVGKYQLKRPQAVYLTGGIVFLTTVPLVLSFGGNAFCTQFLVGPEKVYSIFDMAEALMGFIIPLVALLFVLFLRPQWRLKRVFAAIRQGTKGYRKGWLEAYIYGMTVYIAPLLLLFVLALTLLQTFWGLTVSDILAWLTN